MFKEYSYYRTRFELIGLFSTASIEDGESFLSAIEENGFKDYTYVRLKPDASNYCKKNVIPISFYIFILLIIIFL